MKHVTLIGNIDIIPGGQDGSPENGDIKELILHDPDSGEIIHYKMTQELAEKMARKLKATNKYLLGELEREQARARIEIPGQNGGTMPMSPEVERHLRGQH